jgi:hypothetical protein
VAAVTILGLAGVAEAQAAKPLPNTLRHFLQEELKKGAGGQLEVDTVVHWAAVPLASGGQEFVVLLSGYSWCGTGGCTLLIYEAKGATYREIGHTPAVRQPIRFLSTTKSGRPDLGVWRSWSDTPAYEARIQFNGRRYLMEKEATSLARRGRLLVGQNLIDENDKGQFLYGN